MSHRALSGLVLSYRASCIVLLCLFGRIWLLCMPLYVSVSLRLCWCLTLCVRLLRVFVLCVTTTTIVTATVVTGSGEEASE